MSDANRHTGGSGNDSASDAALQNMAALNRSASPRTLLVGALAVVVGVAAVVLAMEVFIAERIPELTAERLAAARELWQRKGPANYDLDLQILGERPGPVHVEVRDGEIVAMTRDGSSPAKRVWEYWAVPGQFETLERELVMAADPIHEAGAKAGAEWRLRCEFDAEYGYPRRFQRTVLGGGPDVYWRVTHFAVR
jgi:hypothetical protein